jgi:hypothetical protein
MLLNSLKFYKPPLKILDGGACLPPSLSDVIIVKLATKGS